MPPKKKCKVTFTNQELQTIAKKLKHDKWMELGRYLGLEENVLDDIQHRYYDNLLELRTQMLLRWKEIYGLEATQSKLIEGLRDIERNDIADEIEEQNQLLKKNEKIEEMFESIVKTLLNYYINLPLPRAPWLHKKEMTMKELYTDLTLIEKNNEGIKDIKLEDIFQITNDSKRILIEGDPGCGKTTFLFKLACDWANGEHYIRSKFTLVILIALKDFENTVESTICQQIPVENCSAEDMKEIIKLKENNTLLLLDGLDEMQQESKIKLIPILRNEVFGSATVFVTCRKGEANFMIEKETISRKGLFRYGVKQTDSHFWNKTIQVKGFSYDKREQFLKKYFADDPEKLEFANSSLKPVINNLAEVPLFLIILAVVIEDCNAQIKNHMTMTDLFKTLFKFIIKNNLQEEDEVDIFNYYQEKPSLSTSLLLKFGQLALNSLKSGRRYFTKEEIDTCNREDDVKRLGLFTQNEEGKNHEKIETYRTFHVSLLEFAAAFRLSYICDRPENKEEFENVLIKIIRNRPNLMVHQFLVGLLGDKTYLYFNALSSFSAFFPLTPSFMNSVLSEVQRTKQNVRSLLPFVPPVWEVDDDEFFKSDMHSSLLEMATEEKVSRIQSFLWVLDNSVNIPEYFECKYISLYVEDDTEFFQEFQDKMPQTQNIICDALRCQLDFSHEFWDSIVEIINRIKWQKLNLTICGKDIGKIVEKLYNEFTKGSWKSRKHCSLTLVINETDDLNYLPNIKNLLDKTIIHDLTIAIEESAENWSWRKKLSIKSLIGLFWQNRPIQCLIDDIINSPALASFRLFGNKLTEPVYINESFLCKSDWKCILFEGSVEWRNENISNNGLLLDGFAIRRKETDKNIEIDVNLLLAIKSPQAFALSSPHLHELVKKVPSSWQGFESITTMALTLPETFQPIHLEGLLKMKNLKTLSLDLTSGKLSHSVVNDLSRIFCEMHLLNFLDFNISGENLSVYLQLLEKIEQSANFENVENERRSNKQSENSHMITNDTVHSRCQIFHVKNLSIYFDCDSDNDDTKSNVAKIFNIFEKLLCNGQIITFHYYCSLKCLNEIPLYKGSLDFKYKISMLPQEEDNIIELLGSNFVNEYISVSLKN